MKLQKLRYVRLFCRLIINLVSLRFITLIFTNGLAAVEGMRGRAVSALCKTQKLKAATRYFLVLLILAAPVVKHCNSTDHLVSRDFDFQPIFFY